MYHVTSSIIQHTPERFKVHRVRHAVAAVLLPHDGQVSEGKVAPVVVELHLADAGGPVLKQEQ